ncbi:MAG: tRNA uridine-5-carboxymethylaminomethyl(34) synthesis GTPase MnmE, partial [Huintestinicola sp.]
MIIHDNDTIAAISTPRAAGGISVIRISGCRALEIAESIFMPVSTKKRPTEMDGYTCAYGRIESDGKLIDDGILTIFREPRSYTGEDVAEISCHGGIFVTEKVMREIYARGAVPAGAGEFTKRAFENGKMSLTQAEAVMDIIAAEGSAFHRKALNVREGNLYSRIHSDGDELTVLLGKIGAWVDYPEDDIPAVTDEEIVDSLEKIKSDLENILSDYDSTRILRAGVDTVICGKPNVGKSTIMNLLSGYEKSIVTDIAGTTRDVVEESVRLGDIVLRISDTAGIHETNDIVEGAGIKKAKGRIFSCDLIIAVFDSSTPLDGDDEGLIELCRNVNGPSLTILKPWRKNCCTTR